ncbi:MAG: nitroreductase family protein [Acidobacteria bacterium]|jgi:nitroreductase|nr:nitroreductase family protein [Acidobacteriota bacterium]
MPKQTPFGRPVTELARKRFSCRSFDGRGLEPEQLEALANFPVGLDLPFASRLRFGVIDREKVRAENLFSTGSYGMIKGARFYLAALVATDAPRPWEDIGFALETAVLYATALDLGSCWIGGIFDRKNFARALAMKANEMLPAVVALGRPATRPSLRDRLVRWSARGNLRKDPAGLFFAGAWGAPLPLAAADPWSRVLDCVRLAPSASNKQPWRIVRQGSAFHFFLHRDKAYGKLMPLADLQRIDMGIAMCHFQFSAAERGLEGGWADNDPRLPDTPGNFEYIASFVAR